MHFQLLKNRQLFYTVSKFLYLLTTASIFCMHAYVYAYTKEVSNPNMSPAVAQTPNNMASAQDAKDHALANLNQGQGRSSKKVITAKTLPASVTKSNAKEISSPYINKSAGLLVIENGKTMPVTQTPLGKASTKTPIQSEEVLTEYLNTMSGTPVNNPQNASKPNATSTPVNAKPSKTNQDIMQDIKKDAQHDELKNLRQDVQELKSLIKTLVDDKAKSKK